MKSPSMSNTQMLNHSELQILLAYYRDLRGAERAAVDTHVRTCASCAARLADYQAMDRDLENLRDARPDTRLRTHYEAAIQGRAGASTLPRVPARRLPSLSIIAAGAAVLVLAVAVWVVLRPGQPEPSRGVSGPEAVPAAQSAEVGAFIWQTDGAYGYRILRPADWFMQDLQDLDGSAMRPYYGNLTGEEGNGLSLMVANLHARSYVSSTYFTDLITQFDADPTLERLAEFIEQTASNDQSRLTRIDASSDAIIYLQRYGGPTEEPTSLVGIKVVDGHPLLIHLGGDGKYMDLEEFRADPLWDDFLTMVASLQPIPVDPENVSPPAPTPDVSRTPLPTHEPAVMLTAGPITPTMTVEATRDPETTQVTLDIYSGLPNPEWTLTAGQTQDLRALLDVLPETPCQPMNLNLGFRGFVVELGQRPELSNEYRLRIYAGLVRWGDPWNPEAVATCRTDTDNQVARFLLASGQARMPEGVYALVASEVERPDVPTDWLPYADDVFGFSLMHPPSWELTQQTEQSRLFSLKQTELPGPTFPVFYVTVMPEGFTNEQAEAYNFWNAEEVASALALEVGVSGEIHGAPEYNIYTRLRDVTVDGEPGVVVESGHVWEGTSDTIDRRVLVVRNGTTYMLGTYYSTPEELQAFEQVVGTFKFETD
jgi:hypothetical protein